MTGNLKACWLALALVGILLTFQMLLQFWQPVVESRLDGRDDVGAVFGVVFVVFLLAQSLAAHCVQTKADLTHGWAMRLLFTAGVACTCWRYRDVDLAVVVAVLCLAFFITKGLSITVLADIQRVVARNALSRAESAIASFTRILFIATLPFIGAFGDRSDAQGIFVVILLFTTGSFLCLACASRRQANP